MLDSANDSDWRSLDEISLGNAHSSSSCRSTLESIPSVFMLADAYSLIWITLEGRRDQYSGTLTVNSERNIQSTCLINWVSEYFCRWVT